MVVDSRYAPRKEPELRTARGDEDDEKKRKRLKDSHRGKGMEMIHRQAEASHDVYDIMETDDNRRQLELSGNSFAEVFEIKKRELHPSSSSSSLFQIRSILQPSQAIIELVDHLDTTIQFKFQPSRFSSIKGGGVRYYL